MYTTSGQMILEKIYVLTKNQHQIDGTSLIIYRIMIQRYYSNVCFGYTVLHLFQLR